MQQEVENSHHEPHKKDENTRFFPFIQRMINFLCVCAREQS
jgi:hypothetical protein